MNVRAADALTLANSRALKSALLLGAAYFLLAVLCITIAREAEVIAILWYANVIAFVTLLRSEKRDWPSMLVACFVANTLANVLFGDTLIKSTSVALTNLLAYGGAAFAVRTKLPLRDKVVAWQQALALMIFLLAIATPLTAAIGASVLLQLTGAPWQHSFMNWWTGDATAALILLFPALLISKQQLVTLINPRESIALILYYIVTIALIAGLTLFLKFPAVYATVILTLISLRMETIRAAIITACVGIGYSITIVMHPEYFPSSSQFGTHSLLFAVATSCVFPQWMNLVLAQAHQRNQEMRALNQRFELASNAMQLGVWDIDIDTQLVRWNKHMFALYGLPYSSQPLSADQIFTMVHADDRHQIRTATREAIDNRQPQIEVTYRVVHPDGTIHHLRSSTIIEYDTSGQPLRQVGICHDITAQKNFETSQQNLTRSLEQQIDVARKTRADYALLFNSSPGAMLLVDKSGRIMEANDEARTLFDYSSEALLGKPIEILVPEDKRSVHQELRADYQERPDIRHIMADRTLQARRQDGSTFVVEIKLRPVTYQDQSCVLAIVHDITARINAQKMLEAAKEAAEAANRAKSDFVANMSHEIRTPLNAVLGVAQLLERTYLAPEQRKQVAMIRLAGQSLLGIINDVLDFSRIEAGRLELAETDFLLADLISSVQSIMNANAHEKRLQLNIDVDESIPDVLHGDALRLQQVLVNLTGNAIKFTERGFVTLRVTKLALSPDSVKLQFSVIDSGIGISEEQQMRLFKAFTQADTSITREYGGSGLGLTISQRLVNMMHGTITVNSRVGAGSEFCFDITLPWHDTIEKSSIDDNEDMLDLSQLCVLVVDDNPMNQVVTCGILEHTGASIDIANNGQQAVDQLRAAPHKFALVLMDVQMPVMDGFTATRIIREELGLHIPIIAMTAGVMPSERNRCLECGMNDFIAKPVNVSQMMNTLRQHLPRQATCTPDQSATITEAPPVVLYREENVFDVDRLLAIVRSKPTRLQDLVQMISNMIDKGLQPIADARDALAQGRHDDAARILHSLKGSIGSFGAKRFASAAQTAELAIRQQQTQDLNMLLVDAETELAATIGAAKKWLAEFTATTQNPITPTAGSVQTMHEQSTESTSAIYQTLLHHLSEQNIEACRRYAALRPALEPLIDTEALLALDAAFDVLDFTQARQLLLPLGERLSAS